MADEPPDDVPYNKAPPAGTLTQVSPRVRRLIAPNPSPYTFTGTATYIIGNGEVAILDPGPDSPAHLEALLAAVAGETVTRILVTHTHRDHSTGAPALAAATGAPIGGAAKVMPHPDGREASHDPTYQPDFVTQEGDVVELPDATLTALATPGHASNHTAFALTADEVLFSGDHVMGWSTTIVGPPDGSMADYMASLEKVRLRPERLFLPGHGGPITEPQRYSRALLAHRRHREAAILERVRNGDGTVRAVVDALYEHLNPALRGAAERSVLSHLIHLIAQQKIEADTPKPALDSLFAPVSRGAKVPNATS